MADDLQPMGGDGPGFLAGVELQAGVEVLVVEAVALHQLMEAADGLKQVP
ncbi:MAG: hypothetical protein ACKO8I_15195 [Cyanobacteriota bacterium]